MASEMTTLKLNPVRRNSGIMVNGRQYRLKAGQTSIDLPANDAETFRVAFPTLLADEAVIGVDLGKGESFSVATPTAKKKAAPDVVADEAKDS